VNRIILCLAVGLAMVAPARLAHAGDDKPSKEQLDQAKAAFAEGKTLHDAGKLTEAVEKFKESYRLSKNPLLLYNIGLTLDEAGQKDNALLYYRKFISDAPANAAQRPAATERVKVLEKEKLEADLNGTPTKTEPTKTEPTKTEPTKTEPVKTEPVKPVKIKPAGTYSATDFQHQSVDAAPPGKPLDVTAFVPEDSGFTVTLFYRGAGDASFTAKVMKWRYKELVARIPAAALKGNTIQYYIEVKDQAGTKVTSAGKSTNPNLVTIEATATARYYPDMADDSGSLPPPLAGGHSEDEDPLKAGHQEQKHEENPIQQPVGGGDQDTGPKTNYVKWGTTGVAAALIGTGLVTYFMAKNQASNIQNDLLTSGCTSPPCRGFDKFDADFQSAGQSYQTISNVTLALGIVGAGVAGYLWYKESKTKKSDSSATGAPAGSSTAATWVIAPAIGEHFTGAAAAARW
jgi:hypothetical protein